MVHKLARWLRGKGPARQCRRLGFDPWVRKIPQRRKWPPTPVFLPGKSHGQRSLAGYSPRGPKTRTQLSRCAHAETCQMGAGRTAAFLRTQPETQNRTRKGPERASFWIFCLIREGRVSLFPRTALTSAKPQSSLSRGSKAGNRPCHPQEGRFTRRAESRQEKPGASSTGPLPSVQCSAVRFRRSVVSDSLRPYGLPHARPPCPSPTPRVYSKSCPSSR